MNRQLRLAHRVVVVVCLCVFVTPVLAQDQPLTASIDPAVLAEFETKGEATFFVFFREQADLSPASEIQDWGERGQFVYDCLVTTAETSQCGVLDVLVAWGAEKRPFWIVNAIEVSSKSIALITVLAEHKAVAAIVAPPIFESIEMLPGSKPAGERLVEWNIANIGAPQVWNEYGVRGEGITIGNLDTGVQYDHPALVEQYRGNLGGGLFDHNYNWYDFSNQCMDPNVPCDVVGHGTATIGVAVGDDGGENQIGVAPASRFIEAAVESNMSTVLLAMQWMLAPTDLDGENPRPDLRPHIISNSWGWSTASDYFLAAVQAWIAAGMFPAFAAGNDGPDCISILTPARYHESYAVGAHDIGNDIWADSSRGYDSIGWIKPNITAPGVDIRLSVPTSDYLTGSGTSFAAPHVAGTVALMWSLNPELVGKIDTTRLHLDTTGIDVSDLSCGGDPENNNVWGQGRLDAFAAVSLFYADSFESGDTTAWSAVGP